MSTFVILFFLFAATSFTAATLAHFSGVDALIAQLAALSIPTLFVAVVLISLRHEHGLLRAAGKATSVAMGFLNFAFLAALLCWPIHWATNVTGPRV